MRLWSRPLIVAGIGVVLQGLEEGQAAVPVGGGRAWPGFEIDHSEPQARVWRSRGRAAAPGTHSGPAHQGNGLVWFCGPGVLRVVGCYWWCCAHWRAYWLGESQPSALWGCSSL